MYLWKHTMVAKWPLHLHVPAPRRHPEDASWPHLCIQTVVDGVSSVSLSRKVFLWRRLSPTYGPRLRRERPSRPLRSPRETLALPRNYQRVGHLAHLPHHDIVALHRQGSSFRSRTVREAPSEHRNILLKMLGSRTCSRRNCVR